ncbi:MAG: cupin domain-containing protein [Desulfarculaceae bacterium]|jgi:mannose-6-phosphate isomerase-like protein (cupin superfamily)
MPGQSEYKINLDNKFGFLQLIDVPGLVEQCSEEWFNQTLSQVNDCVVRLGIFKGEFHWHKHDLEDEFFFVLQGQLLLDLDDKTITLDQHQGFTVPKGVNHRTRAPQHTVVLMVEGSSVTPTGD